MSSVQAAFSRELPVLDLEDDPPGRGPVGGAELDEHVALLAAALGTLGAGVGGGVSAGCRDLLDRLVDALLEAEALAGAGLLGLGQAQIALVALELDADALGQLPDLRVQRPVLLRVALAELGELLAMALLGIEHRLGGAHLRGHERVARILGGEHLLELLLLMLDRGDEHLLDLALDGVGPLDVEVLGDVLDDLGAALLERAAEILAELADPLLEHALHVVDVGGRSLGVDHPGADLDRLGDGLGRRGPGLGPLADDLGRPLVGDRQGRDHDPVAERPNRRRFVVQRQLV